jgi:hypothetical protein
VPPVVAAAPDDDGAASFTGYEPGGRAVTLAVSPLPQRPVLVVDVDVDTAVALGLQVLQAVTARHGPAPRAAAAGGFTNYSALATAIATVLLTIVDAGAYIPLATAVINAIPASWWTDDPDSYYTLTTQTTGTVAGAAGNGVLQVRPFWVAEL